MINQELLNFIKLQLGQGKSQNEIQNALLGNGWQKADINQAFNAVLNPNLESTQLSVPTSNSMFLGPIALLQNSLQIFKQRYKTLVFISLIPALLTVAIALIMGIGIILGAGSILLTGLNPALFIIFIPVVILLIIASVIISIWSEVALLYSIKDNFGIKESFRKAWHKILSFWWVSVLSSFIIVGGFLLFVIPGIIFAIWFSFAIFILVSEDLKGMTAILKSREYVKGRWFGVFLRLLFILITYLIVVLAISLLGKSGISTFISFVVNLVLPPIAVIYIFLMYENLKSLKGQFVFTPAKRSKTVFILIGIFGFLIIPLGILLPIVLISVNPMQQMAKGRDAARKTDLVEIRRGLENYYVEKGSYPSSLNQLTPTYIKEIPIDPKTKLPFEYNLQTGGIDYKLCATLETSPYSQCLNSMNSKNTNTQASGNNIPTPESSSPEGKMFAFGRDAGRRMMTRQLRSAFDSYHSNYASYPATLKDIVPNYIKSVPLDPKTKQPFEYSGNDKDYKLCVNFETQPSECFNSKSSDPQ